MASKKKNSFFIKLLIILNILCVCCLLLSYISVYISPARIWFIAFFGLTYPFILLINLLFIVFWLLIRKKYALISAISILLGIFYLFRVVQSSKTYEQSELKDAVKVMSFNVRNFNIYSGSDGKDPVYEKNKMLQFIAKEDPDILCLQEYVNYTTGDLKFTDTLKKILHTKNDFEAYTACGRKISFFGIGTFSAFPIVDTGRIVFKTISGNICTWTDMIMETDTVRVYNVHFESIRLRSEDYMFADQIAKKPGEAVEIQKNSLRIFGRLKRAYIIRAAQVELVANHIETCPYPIILCGDFNDTPVSYAYQKITQHLHDAFIESGNGMGQTYAGIFPSFRIDYIMHSDLFDAYNFETVYEEMSDHYPVKCYLKKNTEIR